MPGLHHDSVDCVKKQLVQTVSFQKMAEVAQSRFIWNCFSHDFKGFFPLGFLLAEAVFNVGKGILLHYLAAGW